MNFLNRFVLLAGVVVLFAGVVIDSLAMIWVGGFMILVAIIDRLLI